jgi:hypothetical protein
LLQRLLLDLVQLRHGIIHVDGVALVTEPHDRGLGAATQRTHRLFDTAEAGVSVPF